AQSIGFYANFCLDITPPRAHITAQFIPVPSRYVTVTKRLGPKLALAQSTRAWFPLPLRGGQSHGKGSIHDSHARSWFASGRQPTTRTGQHWHHQRSRRRQREPARH